MIEKTLDVTELPVAETVKAGDQLLLVRTQKNGVKVPMRMEPQKLTKQKKQKKQQIVIGRAIRPQACEIGGVENWYVFGYASWHTNLLLLNIAPMFENVMVDIGYDMVVLNITEQSNGNVYVFKNETTQSDKDQTYMTFWANHVTALTDNWKYVFCVDDNLANAFRVDSYDLTARVLTLNLTHKCLQTTDLRGTSTHHYFKDGVRKWHVSKTNIAINLFYPNFSSRWNGIFVHDFGKNEQVIIPDVSLLVKKEVVQTQHVRNPEYTNVKKRGPGYVVSYSKVTAYNGKKLCEINANGRKRRPFGKYKFWLTHRFCTHRKSDEYLHCRMKCVGLGKMKEDVNRGPRFDKYRVTVRDI